MEEIKLSKTQLFIYIVTLVFTFWGFLNSFRGDGLLNYRYFSNHSLLFVLAVLLIYATKLRNHFLYTYFTFITLINILLTAVIFHILLEVDSMSFAIHNTHTLIPIFFTVFYFVVLEDAIHPKFFWTAVLYPALYLFGFLIIGALTDFYPYPFMDVSERGLGAVLVTTLIIMLPLLLLISALVLITKHHLSSEK